MPNIRHNGGFSDFSVLLELEPRIQNDLERMGLFEAPVYQTGEWATMSRITAGVDDMNAVLRGADRQGAGNDSVLEKSLKVPFFTLDKVVRPDEVQSLIAMGEATVEESVQNKVQRIVRRIQRSHDKLRRAAMYKALVDGKTHNVVNGVDLGVNFADLWEVTAEQFDAGYKAYDLVSAGGKIFDMAEDVRKHIIEKAQDNGDSYDIIMLVHPEAFTKIVTSADFEEAYKYYASNLEPLRQRLGGLKNNRVVEHQGMLYVEDLSGLIPASCGVAFPRGIADMFVTHYAPADTMEHANTEAQEAYLFLDEDRRKTTVESETSLLVSNTRPELICRVQIG